MRYILWIFSIILLGSCSSNSNIPQKNISVAKETKTNIMAPDFAIYNPSTDSTIVYFKIATKNILYTREDKLSPYKANIKIHYQLFPYGNSKTIVDSTSFFIQDEVRSKTSKNLSGNFTINTPDAKDYLLKVTTEDLNRGASIEKKIYLRKSYVHNRQYFLVLKDSTKTPVYNFFVNDTSALQIKAEQHKNQMIFIHHYNRNFNIAAPPFASVNTKPFNYSPDQTTSSQLNALGETKITPPTNGFIHIQTDTSSKVGYTLFKYEKNYPTIHAIEGLVKPLRYICSTAEYNALLNSPTPKKSIDEFWLSKASSKERARELIKQYYNRVEQANKHFSSHVEGWKTDRGMISIIYGTPTVVRKTGRTETWIYGEENNLIALNFVFNQKNNPFSNNDYKLQRSSTYKTSWYRAVDTWRSGRVYYGY
ncbi:MAG: GWxTD domain-containing protein [Flavobacteriales bacterium]|jgi:GWxTD domain-containing protein|nr:GWxTD domain-containing protein [Flavobacteriales bacterium]